MKNLNIAILASGNGTIIPAITKEFSIKLVISNKADAPVLINAAKLGITVMYAKDEHQISDILQQHDIDLILLIGYMKILSPEFVDTWKNKILNVHPSLLPEFAGLMNLKVHQAVIEAGKKQTGCTVHLVDATVDGGSIIVQKTCEVRADDTPETLKARVQALEGLAMVEAIKKFREEKHEH